MIVNDIDSLGKTRRAPYKEGRKTIAINSLSEARLLKRVRCDALYNSGGKKERVVKLFRSV